MRGLLKALPDAVRTVFGIAVVMLVCLTIVGLVLSWIWSHRHSIRLVEIRNSSAITIDEAIATVCGQALRAAKLKPGSAVAMRFRFSCESSYVVRVRLDSGRLLETEAGYVTDGLSGHDIFSVVDANTIRYELRFLSDAVLAAANRQPE